MANPQKQAQFKARQDVLRDEVNLFLSQNKREVAIRHYQDKCACSLDRAVQYVESVDRERRAVNHENFLTRIRSRARYGHAIA
jgi:hypothetical protein